MSAARSPWWMNILVASYAATMIFFAYLVVWGAADFRGIGATFTGDGMVVREIDDDSLAAVVGVRAGDRVLSIGGHPLREARDWAIANGNIAPGVPQPWVVARGGEKLNLEVIPPRASLEGRLKEGYVQVVGLLVSGLALGFLIAWKRPADPVARIGAWFMMTAAIAFGFPYGWAVLWRSLPAPVQALLWIAQLSRFVLEAIFISFFLNFPRRLITRRWVWWAIWIPVVATLPWRVIAFNGVIRPDQVSQWPAWILQAAFFRTMLYLLSGIVILVISYRGFLDANEKRRVRVLIVGTLGSVVTSLFTVWLDNFSGRLQGSNSTLFTLFTFVMFPFSMSCPVSMAYAILRHRILDIQLIVRQGLQYALARGAVLGVIPALAVVLITDLAINSQQSLASIMQSRGWVYFGLAGVAAVVHWKRIQWLDALDRRFFRERYDARRVLKEVVEEIRSARSLQRAAVRAVTQIESSLHPEFVSLMLHEPDQAQYHTVALAPSSATGHTPAVLDAGSKLVGLVRVLGKPLELAVTEMGWLSDRLPKSEIDFVRQSRIDLVVPLTGFAGGQQALLLLGIKRSEEPYTRDDQELLEAIAASLALLLEQPAPVPSRSLPSFKECSSCGSCYDASQAACRQDDGHLVTVHLPRTLSGRYRLERRRGRGGMGTVYEAVDVSLDRHVAVKVIRDDLLNSTDAVERFQREARASAGFSHPNVVTVHDYGIEGTRAFLVMELLEGVTLREELNRLKRMEASAVIAVFRDVCAAVDAAHRRQLIHRDLKPENIFLLRGTAKVLDFGIAKFLPNRSDDAATMVTSQTQAGFLVGTLAYMSPEQLLGDSADIGWDLWALSVVAYEALTGSLPFAGVSSTEWRQAVLKGEFTPLSSHSPQSPAKWNGFFERAFSSHRQLRPASALDLCHDLENVLLA